VTELRLVALPEFPRVESGDDLAALTAAALTRAGLSLEAGDVLVLAQKVISKAEGRRVDLATVTTSDSARELARTVRKDPRLVELVLRESIRVVRAAKDVLIVEHRLGFIMANAGIDQSNVADSAGGEFALLLPEDPDRSANELRERLLRLTGRRHRLCGSCVDSRSSRPEGFIRTSTACHGGGARRRGGFCGFNSDGAGR
jgi:coenzyme F420-0:L-glutamate ligase / coenzyme F420-1:gamma-L-glutamate ligase